jgi:hypothetical protein
MEESGLTIAYLIDPDGTQLRLIHNDGRTLSRRPELVSGSISP